MGGAIDAPGNVSPDLFQLTISPFVASSPALHSSEKPPTASSTPTPPPNIPPTHPLHPRPPLQPNQTTQHPPPPLTKSPKPDDPRRRIQHLRRLRSQRARLRPHIREPAPNHATRIVEPAKEEPTTSLPKNVEQKTDHQTLPARHHRVTRLTQSHVRRLHQFKTHQRLPPLRMDIPLPHVHLRKKLVLEPPTRSHKIWSSAARPADDLVRFMSFQPVMEVQRGGC